MNRTERLHAVGEALRRAGRAGTTGRRLAAQLEVSERTIKRDVAALQQAGAPIWAQAGPGGGYVLDAAATLPPVNFTPAQAVAVAVALAGAPSGSPFSADAGAALGKVRDAMGAADRHRADDLASRVWYDRGGADASTVDPPAVPAVLRAVERSLAEHRVLALVVGAPDGTTERVRVEPVLLARTRGRWYLVAWDGARTAVRWLRLARVLQAHLTTERYVPRPVAEVGEPPATAAPVG